MHLLAADHSPRLRARVVAAVAAAVVCLHLTHLVVAASTHVSIRTGVVVASAAVWAVVLLVALAARRGMGSATAAALHVAGAVAVTADAVWSDSPGHDVIVTAGLVSLAISVGATTSRGANAVAGPVLLACQAVVVLSHQGTGPLGWYVAVSTVAVTAAAGWVSASARAAWRTALTTEARNALVDPLTGLLNRRGMAEGFPALRAAAPAGHRVAAVVLDLDGFKQVNDRYGHEVGDRVLVGVAEVLRSRARSGDLLVRLGGEELAWLGAWPSAELAAAAAEDVRRSVAAWSGLTSGLPEGLRVTTSAGVAFATAHASPDPEALSRLLVRADTALYGAKHDGRDRVVLAPALLPDGSDPHHGAPVPQVRDGGSVGTASAVSASGAGDQRA